MNVWRLIAHHERPLEQAEYYRKDNFIAIGWGGTGDLRQMSVADEHEITRVVARGHPSSSGSNCANGGRSLWRLLREVVPGDLVIVNGNGKRLFVARVTGDYYFVPTVPPVYYEHRRSVQEFPVDPDALWKVAGGIAPGQGVYTTLVRCAYPWAEDDLTDLNTSGECSHGTMNHGGSVMEPSVTLEIAPKTDTEYASDVDSYLSGMRIIQEQMKSDRREIETLRAETDAILADIMRTLRAA